MSTPLKSSTSNKTFKTPGLTIPTPAYKSKLRGHNSAADISMSLSPAASTDTSTHTAGNTADVIDDAAFLPDDFPIASSSEKENTFTKVQVSEQIAAAVERAQQVWTITTKKQLQASVFDEMRQEAEGQLGAHEKMWQEDHDEDLKQCKADFMHQQSIQTDYHEAEMAEQANAHALAVAELRKQYEISEESATNGSKQLRERLVTFERSSLESTSKAEQKIVSLQGEHSQLVMEMQQRHIQGLEQQEREMEEERTIFKQQTEEQAKVNTATILELTTQLKTQSQEMQQQMEQQKEESCQDLADAVSKYEEQLASLEQAKEASFTTLREELTSTHECYIVKLRSEWQESTQQLESAQSELVLQMEQLRKEGVEEKLALEQHVEEAKKGHEVQSETRQKQWDVERTKITEREQGAQLKVEDLSGQIQTLVDSATKVENEMEDLKTQLLQSQELLDTERTTNKLIKDDMWAKHKNELLRLKEELKEKLEAERKATETELNDARANHHNQSEREKELLEKLSKLEIASRKGKDSFDLQVEDVRKEHTAQIDEMLTQLDLIEAEHKERHDTLENSIDQKDAIISALGKQLAETTHRKSELETEHESNLSKLKMTQEELNFSLQGTAELEATVEMLQIEKKDAVETERRKGEAICDKVRNTTIAEAEAQFKTANEHYMTLKHEYDGALGKIGKLEKEIKAVRRDVESARSDGASREAEVAAELAQLRASLAKSEAAAARKVADLRSKMEVAQAMHRESKTKLEESNEARHAANMSLTSLVSEKEKLTKENKDLNAVCEELMAIVEGGGDLAAD